MRLNAKKLLAKMLATEGDKCPAEPGVYAITHIPTGRTYVGCSTNIRRRLQGHRSNLKAGRHTNQLLQAEWLEHGADAFTYGALMICHPWDRFIIEQMITRQLLGPSCYNWSAAGQKSRIEGHPAVPGLGRCW